jgi:hypothetical protein
MLAVVLLIGAGDPSTNPASAPTTAPAPDRQTLAGGAISFAIPDGLKLLGKRNDDLGAGLAPPDDSALVQITVAPQTTTIDDHLGPKLGQLVIKTIKEQAAKGEIETIAPPKMETDDRFLLRVHDRFKQKGKTCDRVQLYRGVGKFLVSVTATAFSDDTAKSRPIHLLGEQLMQGVKLNRQQQQQPKQPQQQPRTSKPAGPGVSPTTRPVSFPSAKIRLNPPTGWREESNDNPSGIIATYHDPDDRTNLIAVSVRQLPAEAKTDPKLRDALIDEIVKGEKQSFAIDGAQPQGQAQTITDRRFLRKVRTDYEAKGVKFRVTSRQIRAGDAIVSITIVALQEQADAIDTLADQVALSARPMGAPSSR